MKTFKLTDPGEGLTEAEIITWLVAEGDEVAINDIVVEVETSKSLVELPIPWAGTVSQIMVPAGETVEVGTPIIKIDDGTGEEEEEAPTPERTPNLVGYGPSEGSTSRRPRRTRTAEPETVEIKDQLSESLTSVAPVGFHAGDRAPLPAGQAAAPGAPLPSPGQPPVRQPSFVRAAKVLAKPPVRKLAKVLGVDLTQLEGSGPSGTIMRADVEAAGAELKAAEAAAVPASGEDRRVPIRGVRKKTAQAMVASAFTAPHASEWTTFDITETMELLERIRRHRDFRDVRVSPLLLVAKAVMLALGRTPELNTAWDEPAQEIIYRGSVNLGIAAATPRGLLVPNIKGANRLSLLELATAINDLVVVAKEGRTQPAALSGGTFTITNVGSFGIDSGTPILNPGEAGILALGAIDRRPWVVGEGAEERIEPRWVTTLSVAFDHRLVDGEHGARFLADVARILQDPGFGLLF